MKFAALALALLLAVGSQAAPMQADAPATLTHIRSAMDVYSDQFKEGAKAVLGQLDQADQTELRDSLIKRVDDIHTQVREWREAAAPMTDAVVTQFTDGTADFRASVMRDYDSIQTNLQKLKTVLEKHTGEYRTILNVPLQQALDKFVAEAEKLKTELDPTLEQVRSRMSTNVEETRSALAPIRENVVEMASKALTSLRENVGPYVNEYYEHLKSFNPDSLTQMKAKMEPIGKEILEKTRELGTIITDTYVKN